MSTTRNIITAPIPKNRIISIFQSAYHADATPYKQFNFNPQVKSACEQNRTGRVGLKICKSVIVGDVAVGKTSLVNRFCHDVFDRDYKATIGVDFEVEKFQVLNIPFTLQMWDTAGQERFKCIAASYYRGSNVVIVAFDLTEEATLISAPRWMQDASKNADEPVKFLIGLKKDLLSPAAYSEIEPRAINVANSIGAEFWAMSSKTGQNVSHFFFRAVALTFDAGIMRELDVSANQPSKQIGSLVHLNTANENMYDKKSNKLQKCCA